MSVLETAYLVPHEYRNYCLVTYSDLSIKMSANIHLVPSLRIRGKDGEVDVHHKRKKK
jgi:hypothetical protein